MLEYIKQRGRFTKGAVIIDMKFKKTICALLSLAAITGTTALAKDNLYAYNKFVSTILSKQAGYCNFSASFAGHESEYDNVNDYFKGLIAASYADLDGDYDNELVTVESHGVSVYRVEEKGVVYLGSVNNDLIANYGDSYSNVFTVAEKNKNYIGVELYGKTANEYHLYLYDLNPDTDEFKKILDISREDNEDGKEEKVWAGDKTYYSYTNSGGFETSINPSGYVSSSDAARAAIADIAPVMNINANELKARMEGTFDAEDCRLKLADIKLMSYTRAKGIRFDEKPVVLFEDNSPLNELAKKIDIITVTFDGDVMKFPYFLDPVMVNDSTMVPMRTIFEALGAKVDWIDENGVQRIIATKDNVELVDENGEQSTIVTEDNIVIEMTIGSNIYYKNGDPYELDVPAQLMNDTTMVQLRAVSEAFGNSVEWNGEERTVTISSRTK